MKTYADCTADEALNFLNLYFATMDVLYMAHKRYDALSAESITLWERGKYRALALDTLRDIERMKNQRRHFMNDSLGIEPPSAQVVAHTKALGTQLAQANAAALTGAALIALVDKALGSFDLMVNGAAGLG